MASIYKFFGAKFLTAVKYFGEVLNSWLFFSMSDHKHKEDGTGYASSSSSSSPDKNKIKKKRKVEDRPSRRDGDRRRRNYRDV